MKKIIAVVISIIMCMGLASGIATGEVQASDTIAAVSGQGKSVDVTASEEQSAGVTILYTNDIHTYINNKEKDDEGMEHRGLSYASVAALKDELQADGENVILVDAGDHFQGTAYGAMDEGLSIIDIMNATGYQLATVGNHEFDYGQFTFFRNAELMETPYVCCNFYKIDYLEMTDIGNSEAIDEIPEAADVENSMLADETCADKDIAEKHELVFPAFQVIEAEGVKVAFVGVMTPETISKSSTVYFQDETGRFIYGIDGGIDGQGLYDCVQKAVDEAGQEADYVIALGHLGTDQSSAPFRSIDVINNTTGIDAFIDGHSHNVMEKEMVKDASGKDVLLTQTGCYLGAIGKMTIKDGVIDTQLIKEYEGTNENVRALEDAWIAKVDESLGERIAMLEKALYIYDPENPEVRLVRRMETNLGDFVADAYYYYFNEVENLDCDIAVSVGGGIRTDVDAGDVTFGTCKNVSPFGNVMCMIEVTGQEMLEVLEWGARAVGVVNEDGKPAEVGGFIQTAGLIYTIDTSVESSVVADETGTWVAGPSGEYKVKEVKVYNKENAAYEDLDPGKVYTLCGINYNLRNSGDGYMMLTDNKLVKDYVGEDYMALARYFEAFAAGGAGVPVVNNENSPLNSYKNYLLDYENPYGSGRIIIK